MRATARSLGSISRSRHRSTQLLVFSTTGIEDLDEVFGGDKQGHSYARFGNPTISAVEEQLAALRRAARFYRNVVGHGGDSLGAAYRSNRPAQVDRSRRRALRSNDPGSDGAACTHRNRCFRSAMCAISRGLTRAVESARPAAVYVETISNPLMRLRRSTRWLRSPIGTVRC